MKKRISEMSDDEKRIAIAEACGWTNIEDKPHRGGLTGTTPKHVGFHFENLPHYLTSLDAMHEAEKTLTGEQWWNYAERLTYICYPSEHQFAAVRSTAAQRAEAFLLTIGHEL